MVTIFTIPKAFNGEDAVTQRNALTSWKLLGTEVEIILLGDDPGVAETAKAYGFKHIPNVTKNEFGTPLVSSAFEQAEKHASHQVLCYCNTDIILPPDFVTAVKAVDQHFDKFLLAGQRWDMDINEEMDYSDPGWYSNLRSQVALEGVLHRQSGIDYFVYRKGFYGTIPPFAVGRMAWDNWLVKRAADLGAAVVDATDAVFIVHHNHGYDHANGGEKAIWGAGNDLGEEVKRNKMLADMPTGEAGYIQNASTWRLLQWRFVPAGKADLSTVSRNAASQWPSIMAQLTPLIENGQIEKAVEILNTVRPQMGHMSEYHYVYGVALAHLGRIGIAAQACREALRINPGEEAAKQLLTMLESSGASRGNEEPKPQEMAESPFVQRT